MPTVAPSAAADAGPSRRRPWLRAASYAARAAAAAFVLWICWSGSKTFTALVRDEPATTTTDPIAAAAPGAGPLDWTQVVTAGGGWSFGESGWSVNVRTVGEAELANVFALPLADPAQFAARGATEQAVLDLLAQNFGTSHQRDGGRDHTYDDGAIRAAIRTRDTADGPRVCWARAALRRGAADWTVIEARPDSQSAAAPTVGTLLPCPPDAELLASRLGPSGEVACEFVRIPGNLAGLIEHWQGHNSAPAAVETTPVVHGDAGIDEFLAVAGNRMYRVAALSNSSTGTTLMIAALDAPATPQVSTPTKTAP